ncbi:MAG TPA: DUF2804 domain-containing protein [Microthrixaceae bacterium]|nr:DUF2804 domain-containing protein [Microthrixaceae bacterium]
MDPTHEREITSPVDLCTPNGDALNPEARGWSRRPLHRANFQGGWGRTKRWDYWAVLAGDMVFGLVYADVDYLGLASVWWGDLATQRSGGTDVAIPLSKGISLPEISGTAPLSFKNKKLSLNIVDEPGSADGPGPDGNAGPDENYDGNSHGPTTRITAEWTESGGVPATFDFTIRRPAGHESLNVVIPWSDTRFNFTTKDQGLPTTGFFTLGDVSTQIGGPGSPAWGVLDVGRGRWPYSTIWNWGGGAGVATTGEMVGIQFGAKWTEGTGFTENGITVDGRLHKIGRELSWDYSWDDPMEPWHVSDSQGALDLTLTPRFDKYGKTNALALRTEVHQVFGTWSGTVVSDDGRKIQIEDAQGFAEESRNRW